jgi:thioredoxin reductase
VRDRRRRRLGARLDARAAGHGEAPDRARASPGQLPRARVLGQRGQTGAVEQVDCDALITLLGFHSHLGAIAEWGLELHGKRQILIEPTTCETTVPGVYAAGDVAGYEGKITLITIGMGEAAIAANNAVARIRGEKVQPKYSTD